MMTTEKVTIHIIDYSETSFEEKTVSTLDACSSFREKSTVTWINVDAVHDVAMVEKLGNCFGLHGLVTEDIVNTVQRPKMEDYGESLFVVLKMLSKDAAGNLISEQLSIVISENFVLSFQEGIKGDVFTSVRERLRNGRGRIRKMGADYLAHALIDAVVDNYFVVLESIGEQIELLEAELVENPMQQTVRQIYHVRRELIFVHNAVWPLREALAGLIRRESPIIRKSTEPYLRDVHDHVVQIIASVDIYREMTTGMLDLYLSSVSTRLNEVMRVLTVISLVFMPLTFIAGVYGMNFKHMPELEWPYGYPASLMLMAAIVIFMVIYFKRKKWL